MAFEESNFLCVEEIEVSEMHSTDDVIKGIEIGIGIAGIIISILT